MDKDKTTVCFTIEKSYSDKIKHISNTKGPSSARIIERAVEEYLKNKNPVDVHEDEKKKQMCFYPSDETQDKLKRVAKDEGRSVSNLVSVIVKNYIRDEEDEKK
ncbi:MAG: hypothetical protein KKG99_17435 [Bacteroidetes bacterium]|nr:hypothetical protein [Bacteroidota bacterium]